MDKNNLTHDEIILSSYLKDIALLSIKDFCNNLPLLPKDDYENALLSLGYQYESFDLLFAQIAYNIQATLNYSDYFSRYQTMQTILQPFTSEFGIEPERKLANTHRCLYADFYKRAVGRDYPTHYSFDPSNGWLACGKKWTDTMLMRLDSKTLDLMDKAKYNLGYHWSVEYLSIHEFDLLKSAQGLGHATAAASWLMFIGTNFFLQRRFGKIFQFKFVAISKLKEIFQLGMPIAIQLGAELITLTAAVQMCGLLGENALAAAEATLQWVNYVIIPVQTLSQAANILVSQELKENQFNNAKKIDNLSPIILAIFPMMRLIIFAIVGRYLAEVFINDHSIVDLTQKTAVIDTAQTLMLITSSSLIIDAIRTGFAGSLRGYSYTKIPGITGVINLGILALVCSYVSGMVLNWGAEGIFAARILPITIDSLILFGLWRKVNSRKQNVDMTPLIEAHPHESSEIAKNTV